MPLPSLGSMGRHNPAVQAQRSPGKSGRCVHCRPPVFVASHSLTGQVSMPDTCTQICSAICRQQGATKL